VKQTRQAAVELSSASDDTSCRIHHALKAGQFTTAEEKWLSFEVSLHYGRSKAINSGVFYVLNQPSPKQNVHKMIT